MANTTELKRGALVSGFTLLEILLVLALMALILVGLSSTIRLFSRHYTANERRVGRAQLARSISQMLSDDLGAAIQDPIQALSDDPSRQYARHFGLRGDSRSLQIDVVQPNSFVPTADPEENRRVMSGGDKTPLARQVPELKTIFYEFVPINALANPIDSAPTPAPTAPGEDLGSTLSGSLTTSADDVAALDSNAPIFWDGIQPLAQKYGLSRRELDYETPDEEEESENSQTPSSTANVFGPVDESRLAGSLSALPDASFSTLASGDSANQTTNAEETTTVLLPMTAPQIAMDADDGSSWAPEVLDCRFSYFDGNEWFDSWDSLEKNGLPVAIKVELKLAPLDDVDFYRSSPLMTRLPFAPDLETLANAAALAQKEEESPLSGSLAAPPTQKNRSVDVFNSYRPPSAYYAAYRGVESVERKAYSDVERSALAPEEKSESNVGALGDDPLAEPNDEPPQLALQGGLETPDSNDRTTTDEGTTNFEAESAQMQRSGAVFNDAGVCVDFGNPGDYATLEDFAAEIGVAQPIVFEFISYLPTTPFSRANTIARRRPVAARRGAVVTNRPGRETGRGRRTPGANPYATGQARAPRERQVQERASQERRVEERTAATRNATDRVVAERGRWNRATSERTTSERGVRDRTANERTIVERQERERVGRFNGGTGVENAIYDATPAPVGEPLAAPTGAFEAPAPTRTPPTPNATTLSGGSLNQNGATRLDYDPFAILDQQTDTTPFADSTSAFSAIDSEYGAFGPRLVESPDGTPTTVTPNPAPTRNQSQGVKQTWIRGKK